MIDDSLFLPLNRDLAAGESAESPSLSYWSQVRRRFRRNRVATVGALFLIGMFLFALLVPWLSPHTYYETHLALKNSPPSKTFWFGTDNLGRDMFTRIACGARISLFVGVSAAIIDLIIGVLFGGMAALGGARIDNAMMRLADIMFAIPYLLIVIMLMVVLGSGLIPILIALTLTGWIGMARIVRGQLLQLQKLDYVQAAIALGAGPRRILFKHLLPNAMGPILVTLTLTIPLAIFTEAFLSFLGLGVQAPIASWGTMASDALPALRYYPWRLFFPACFISLTMLAFNLVGDGLRDALDPKQRVG